MVRVPPGAGTYSVAHIMSNPITLRQTSGAVHFFTHFNSYAGMIFGSPFSGHRLVPSVLTPGASKCNTKTVVGFTEHW